MNDRGIVETLIKRLKSERKVKVNGINYFMQIDLSYTMAKDSDIDIDL